MAVRPHPALTARAGQNRPKAEQTVTIRGGFSGRDIQADVVETAEEILGQMDAAFENILEQTGGLPDDEDETSFRNVQEDEEARAADGGEYLPQRTIYEGPGQGSSATQSPASGGTGRNLTQDGRMKALMMSEGMPEWKPLLEAPGYSDPGRRGEMVRTMGRTIFRSIANFRRLETAARAEGLDPLGQLRVCACKGAPSGAMQNMLEWLTRHGTPVAAQKMDFGAMAPNYKPQILGVMTDNDTFLIVKETSPGPAVYIYAMPGGLLEQTRELTTESAPAVLAQSQQPQRPRMDARPKSTPTPSARMDARPTLPEPTARMNAQPKPTVAPAPVPPKPVSFMGVKSAGFELRGTPQGPRLQQKKDGTLFELACTGPIAMAKSYDVYRVNGSEREQIATVRTMADLEDAISVPSQSSRPKGP